MRCDLGPSLTSRAFLHGVLALLIALVLTPAVAAAQTPDVGGYGGVAPATVEGTTPPASGTAGAQAEGNAPAGVAGEEATVAPAVADDGRLPFTGLQLAFMVAAALGLVAVGLALRRTTDSTRLRA